VVERILPGHFARDMAMSLVDQGVLHELLGREEPQLSAHLDELQVVPSLVHSRWLLTCFVGSPLPLATLLRLWDCMFYEGDISFLFRAACALTKLHRQQLLDADNTADAYKALVGVGAQLRDVDALLAAAYSYPWGALMQPRQLAALRQASTQRMVQEQAPGAEQAVAATAAAAAAVAAAEATREASRGGEGRSSSQLPEALAAAPGSSGQDSGWTLVPVPRSALASAGTAESEHERLAEGWSLVERIRGGNGACSSSLSYVIMQTEQPSLVEGYFAGGVSMLRVRLCLLYLACSLTHPATHSLTHSLSHPLCRRGQHGRGRASSPEARSGALCTRWADRALHESPRCALVTKYIAGCSKWAHMAQLSNSIGCAAAESASRISRALGVEYSQHGIA